MNIIMCTSSIPSTFRGGIPSHVWNLSRELSRNGHTVHIVTGGNFRRTESSNPFDKVHVYFAAKISFKIPFVCKLNVVSMITWNIFCYFLIRRLIKTKSIDLVHLHIYHGFLYPFCKRPLDPPWIVTFHSTALREHRARRLNRCDSLQERVDSLLFDPFRIAVERRIARTAQRIIAVSHKTANDCIIGYGVSAGTISVIPNGVDCSFFTPAKTPQKENPYFLYVGRMEARKGIDVLVRAVEACRESRPVAVVMVGDGPVRSRIERLIGEKNLQNIICLTGEVNDCQLLSHVQSCTALVMPSYEEGLGIVLLECMACARPVIASNIPGPDEVVRDGKTGLLFPAGDSGELSKKMRYVQEHPAESNRMGEAARRRVEEYFSWNSVARRVYSEYRKSIVDGRR